jgi:hypothetical protein
MCSDPYRPVYTNNDVRKEFLVRVNRPCGKMFIIKALRVSHFFVELC